MASVSTVKPERSEKQLEFTSVLESACVCFRVKMTDMFVEGPEKMGPSLFPLPRFSFSIPFVGSYLPRLCH